MNTDAKEKTFSDEDMQKAFDEHTLDKKKPVVKGLKSRFMNRLNKAKMSTDKLGMSTGKKIVSKGTLSAIKEQERMTKNRYRPSTALLNKKKREYLEHLGFSNIKNRNGQVFTAKYDGTVFDLNGINMLIKELRSKK